MRKEIRTSTGLLWIDEALGIARFTYDRGSVTTAVEAREDLAAMRKIAEGKRYPLLCDITKCKSVDREARAIFGSEESYAVLRAVALLSKTPIGNIIGNFFLSFYSEHQAPTKLFTSEREAIAWLKQFAET